MSRARRLANRLVVGVLAVLLLCTDLQAAAPARTTPIVVRVDRGGFRLTDAAIGAAAGAGAVLVATGVAALLRLRRERNRGPKGERA
jgi:uncharacterized membrane protein